MNGRISFQNRVISAIIDDGLRKGRLKMNQITQMVIILLGGLAVFIYGINLMSDGIQKSAGDKTKNILNILTKNPFMGLLTGALVTAALQSSSVMTVMVIGFVSAGLIKLPQAISVVLGANIGTTITAQIIAFNIGDYAWGFVLAGFIMYYFIKKPQVQNIGQSIFAFGLLFVGINVMADIMNPLFETATSSALIANLSSIPLLGLAAGTAATAVIQSSSASIAFLQTMASTAGPDGFSSIIGLQGAIPILLGANIGTTISAILAAIGASVNAKRTALANTIYNIIGASAFMLFIPAFVRLIQQISPAGQELDVISRQIANAHFLFNIICALICFPLIWALAKLVTKIIPGEDTAKIASEPAYLDYKVIDTPIFAVPLAAEELARLGGVAAEMISFARDAFLKNNYKSVYKVQELEEVLNILQGKIVQYLSAMIGGDSLTELQTVQISGLINVAADIEHVGDHCINISEFAEEKIKKDYDFSETAVAEISVCFDQIEYMMKTTINALKTRDIYVAKDVLEQEKQVNMMDARLRKQHLKRLSERKCSPEFTVVYADIIHDIEKIGDYCSNIAEAVLKNATLNDKKSSGKS